MCEKPWTKKVLLQFGALAPKISEQLNKQGLTYKGNWTEASVSKTHFQRDADAITRLFVRGLISDVTAKRARQKLLNRIAGIVESRHVPVR